MEFTKSLVEVQEIINQLSEEELNKIPKDVLRTIENKKDRNYQWKYDKTKSLKEQNISRTTIAILSYLNMEYLLNEKQAEYIKELHQQNEKKLEMSKMNNGNYDLFKNNTKNTNDTNNTNNTEKTHTEEIKLPVIKKEKWYEKIINAIKRIFEKNK